MREGKKLNQQYEKNMQVILHLAKECMCTYGIDIDTLQSKAALIGIDESMLKLCFKLLLNSHKIMNNGFWYYLPNDQESEYHVKYDPAFISTKRKNILDINLSKRRCKAKI